MMTGSRVYSTGGGGVNGDSKLSVMLQSQSPSSPSPLFGLKNMMSFEDIHSVKESNNTFLRPYDFDEDLDGSFHQPEKKRRLTDDQAKFLEKCFEDENKLEPERKIQLAKELGLQPRQISIWFQNRRARWKTKRLEKDFGSLQSSYDNLKADYESLVKENDKLKSQARVLKDNLVMKDEEKRDPELSSDIISTPIEETTRKAMSDCLLSKDSGVVACKQEEMSSAIFDSDARSSVILEAGSSSYVFEHDQSDQDDSLSKSLFHTYTGYTFPKVEDVDYSGPSTSSCNFAFAAEEDQAFWSWSYS